MKVKGVIKPLRDRVFVSDMEFGSQTTKGGLFVPSTDGKETGIMPRWGKVFAIGPEQKDVAVGQWVMVEHGRWTRTVNLEQDDGEVLQVRMIDSNAIMCVSDDRPDYDIYRNNIR
jgi:co-chaperonin GroES (HSP10)